MPLPEPWRGARSSRNVLRTLLAVVIAAFIAAPGASAKVAVHLKGAPLSPRAKSEVRVTITTDPAMTQRDAVMRLYALAHGVDLYGALSALMGGYLMFQRAFAVELTREGGTWRGKLRFPRAGRWRLVIPNEGAPGYMIPPPVIRRVLVH
jgi:hypothetical protein